MSVTPKELAAAMVKRAQADLAAWGAARARSPAPRVDARCTALKTSIDRALRQLDGDVPGPDSHRRRVTLHAWSVHEHLERLVVFFTEAAGEAG